MPKRWPTVLLLLLSLAAIGPALLRVEPPPLAAFGGPDHGRLDPLAAVGLARLLVPDPLPPGADDIAGADGDTTGADGDTAADEQAVVLGAAGAGAADGGGVEDEIAWVASDDARPSHTAPDGWPFGPLARPPVPAIGDGPRHPIDAFVLQRLGEVGLAPNPPADRVTWIRRATLDLHGLPPTPEEVQAYLDDAAEGAEERVVDRLLASPRYGERQAQAWLDTVGYADSASSQPNVATTWPDADSSATPADGGAPGAARAGDASVLWRYRDWVVDALNADLPYDEFVRQQLAGDELDAVTPQSRVATGYYRIPRVELDGSTSPAQARAAELDAIASTTASAFLGLPLGCARCHDHGAGQLLPRDHDRFRAFFAKLDTSRPGQLEDVSTASERRAAEFLEAERSAERARLSAALHATESRVRAALLAADGAPRELFTLDQLAWKSRPGRFADIDAAESWRPQSQGRLPDGRIDPGVGGPGPRALAFTGDLLVERSGEASFRLESNGPARLLVNGHRLAALGPEGGRAEIRCHLRAGPVPLRVDMLVGGTLADGGTLVDRDALANRDTLTNRDTLVGGDAPELLLLWRREIDEQWRSTTTRPDGDWTTPGYDDSGWLVGGPVFGADAAGLPVDTSWTRGELWLRRELDWSGPLSAFGLLARHDGELALFVNGRPAAAARGTSLAWALLPLAETGRLAPRAGSNTLAVLGRPGAGVALAHVRCFDRRLAAALPLDELAEGWLPLSVLPARPERAGADPLVLARVAEVLAADELLAYERDLAALHDLRAQPSRRLAAVVRELDGGPGDDVDTTSPCGLPSVLGISPLAITPREHSSGRRRALADWLAAPGHALAARVAVNRIWQHHFGRGLVATPDDFSAGGEPPTHPELLDWLAAELVAADGSLKHVHRLIMTSSTYRSSSQPRADGAERDPENRWLWRFSPRRLSADERRDAQIFLTGRLDDRIGGPAGEDAQLPPELRTLRRSLYSRVERALVAGAIGSGSGGGIAIGSGSGSAVGIGIGSASGSGSGTAGGTDAERDPEAESETETEAEAESETDTETDTDRDTATVSVPRGRCPVLAANDAAIAPPGALAGAEHLHLASLFAQRLAVEAGDDGESRVRLALRLATGREPGLDEVGRALELLAALQAGAQASNEVWTAFARLVLDRDELTYLD